MKFHDRLHREIEHLTGIPMDQYRIMWVNIGHAIKLKYIVAKRSDLDFSNAGFERKGTLTWVPNAKGKALFKKWTIQEESLASALAKDGWKWLKRWFHRRKQG